MRKAKYLVLAIVVGLAVLLAACQGAATPTPTPAPSPAPTPSPSPKPSPSPTPTPTPSPKPTAKPAAAPVSFAGKTITIIVPNTAGGGGDLTARLYAKSLRRFLPGNPTVIVRNMPGGASTIGTNYAYSSKPDGLTLVTSASNSIMSYIQRIPAVHYDLQKMEAILGTAQGNFYIAKRSIVPTVEDLLKAKGIIAGMPVSPGNLLITIMKLLDFHPERVVLTYSSTSDGRRAFLSGEINMTAETSYEAVAPYVATGEVLLLFQSGIYNETGAIVGDPSLPPDLPTAKELYERLYGKSPSGMAWDAYAALVAVLRSYGDALLLPPETPDSIVRVYWDAAQKMVQDPEFRKLAASLENEKTPWFAGEDFSKAFHAGITVDPKIVDWIRAAAAEYGIAW